MKKHLINCIIIGIFLFLILWIVDFNVFEIFDIKIMFVMLLCIILLTTTSYKKSESDFRILFAYQVALTSIFATSLLFLQELSKSSIINFIVPLQPILYGILFYILGYIYYNLTRDKSSGSTDHKTLLQEKYGLSIREVAIALEVLNDKTNKEIAAKLFIAESTVKKHVQNILRKTTVTNRQEFKKLIHHQEGISID